MKKTALAVAFASASISASASGAVIEWTTGSGGNGHFYQFVAAPVASWDVARAAALASTHNGQSGYLATITSAAENSFISGTVSGSIGWLGGRDAATEGVWQWADGPEAGVTFWTGGPGGSTTTYANWVGGEPNNNLGTEDWLHFNFGVAGGWNDAQFADTNNGYFIEYNAVPVITPGGVPEPAAWAMMIAGFGLTGGVMRWRVRSGGAPAPV